MALASNAPTSLKTQVWVFLLWWPNLTCIAQALRLLPTNISFPFSEISVTPYVPVPETNGEEWDRLEAASALDALVELAIHGEYNGLGAGSRSKRSLELRTVAAAVFEVTKKIVYGSHRFKHYAEFCSQRRNQAGHRSSHASTWNFWYDNFKSSNFGPCWN